MQLSNLHMKYKLSVSCNLLYKPSFVVEKLANGEKGREGVKVNRKDKCQFI